MSEETIGVIVLILITNVGWLLTYWNLRGHKSASGCLLCKKISRRTGVQFIQSCVYENCPVWKSLKEG